MGITFLRSFKMIEQIKNHMKEIEDAIQQVVLNHAGLVSRLETCKHFLDLATKAAEGNVLATPEEPKEEAVNSAAG